MKPENVKLLFRSFIECEQNQDEIDGVGDLAGEYDNPIRPHPYSGGAVSFVPQMGFNIGGNSTSDLSPLFHSFPLGSAHALPMNVTAAGRNLVRMAQEFSTSQPDKSIVKFKEICMVTAPTEQTISIPILRDQAFSQNATTVSWKTCDKTAISGIHYIRSNGEIIFNKGERSKDIQVQIMNSANNSSFDDLRFTVELSCGVFNPTPMTVSLKKISNLDSPEQMVLNNLPRSLPFSVSDVKYVLDGCLNARTLHMALTHLCSTSNVVDVQIALAFQLCSLCLHKSSGSCLPFGTVSNVLSDFFRRDDYDFENAS